MPADLPEGMRFIQYHRREKLPNKAVRCSSVWQGVLSGPSALDYSRDSWGWKDPVGSLSVSWTLKIR